MDVLARVAQVTVESEYYENIKPTERAHLSLKTGNFRMQSQPNHN